MKLGFYMVFIIISLAQLLGVFRSTGLYNTSNIITTMIGINGLIFVAIFILKILTKKIKLNIYEGIFFIYISLNLFISLIVYKNNYLEAFIDYFNFLVFISILNLNFQNLFQKNKDRIYKLLFYTLLVSAISYLIFIKLGYSTGVGKTSIQMLYLYIYNLVLLKPNMFPLILLLWAQKRGVLLSIAIVYIFNKLLFNRKILKKICILGLTIIIMTTLLYFNSNIDNYKYIPDVGKAMFVKFNRINPLNLNKDVKQSDPRIIEIKLALTKIDSKLKVVIGTGVGSIYEHEHKTGKIEKKKNIHISPIGLIYKIGILGTVLFYMIIFKYLFRTNLKKMDTIEKISYYYVIGALINSLTAYTYFIDYLFLISLSVVKNIKNKEKENVK